MAEKKLTRKLRAKVIAAYQDAQSVVDAVIQLAWAAGAVEHRAMEPRLPYKFPPGSLDESIAAACERYRRLWGACDKLSQTKDDVCHALHEVNPYPAEVAGRLSASYSQLTVEYALELLSFVDREQGGWFIDWPAEKVEARGPEVWLALSEQHPDAVDVALSLKRHLYKEAYRATGDSTLERPTEPVFRNPDVQKAYDMLKRGVDYDEIVRATNKSVEHIRKLASDNSLTKGHAKKKRNSAAE